MKEWLVYVHRNRNELHKKWMKYKETDGDKKYNEWNNRWSAGWMIKTREHKQ